LFNGCGFFALGFGRWRICGWLDAFLTRGFDSPPLLSIPASIVLNAIFHPAGDPSNCAESAAHYSLSGCKVLLESESHQELTLLPYSLFNNPRTAGSSKKSSRQ
jgi:hypothetical protein